MTQQSIELLKAALEIEKKGQAFYEKAAKTCKNKLGQEVFATLAKDEGTHLERVKMIYESLNAGKEWTKDWQKVKEAKTPGDIYEVLSEMKEVKDTVDKSDLEAFDLGIGLEEESIAFYDKQLKGASDPLEKEFAQRMVVEEKAHLKVLKDTKFYLTDPEAYFLETEKAEYDAG